MRRGEGREECEDVDRNEERSGGIDEIVNERGDDAIFSHKNDVGSRYLTPSARTRRNYRARFENDGVDDDAGAVNNNEWLERLVATMRAMRRADRGRRSEDVSGI